MAGTMSAATMAMVAPQATVASTKLSSGSSVAFNSGALRFNMVASSWRSAHPLAIRAYGPRAGTPGTGKDEREAWAGSPEMSGRSTAPPASSTNPRRRPRRRTTPTASTSWTSCKTLEGL